MGLRVLARPITRQEQVFTSPQGLPAIDTQRGQLPPSTSNPGKRKRPHTEEVNNSQYQESTKRSHLESAEVTNILLPGSGAEEYGTSNERWKSLQYGKKSSSSDNESYTPLDSPRIFASKIQPIPFTRKAEMKGHQPHRSEPVPIDTEGGTTALHGVYPSSSSRPILPIPSKALAPPLYSPMTIRSIDHPFPLHETPFPRDPPLGSPNVMISPDLPLLRKHPPSPPNETSLPNNSVRENVPIYTNGTNTMTGLLQLVKALRPDEPDYSNQETHAAPEIDFSILVEEVYRLKWELGLLRVHLSKSDSAKLLQFQEEARERVRQLGMMRDVFNCFKPTTKPTHLSRQSPGTPHIVLEPPPPTDLSLGKSRDQSGALNEPPMNEIFPSFSQESNALDGSDADVDFEYPEFDTPESPKLKLEESAIPNPSPDETHDSFVELHPHDPTNVRVGSRSLSDFDINRDPSPYLMSVGVGLSAGVSSGLAKVEEGEADFISPDTGAVNEPAIARFISRDPGDVHHSDQTHAIHGTSGNSAEDTTLEGKDKRHSTAHRFKHAHLRVIFHTTDKNMICRLCLQKTPQRVFMVPAGTEKMNGIVTHCEENHQDVCEHLLAMSDMQLAAMAQRLETCAK